MVVLSRVEKSCSEILNNSNFSNLCFLELFSSTFKNSGPHRDEVNGIFEVGVCMRVLNILINH
jgi:hypothetical protein